MSKEEWKNTHINDNYEISSLGRIRSKDRIIYFTQKNGISGSQFWRGKILNPVINSKGYPAVKLGRHKIYLVHQLVAEAFLGYKPFAKAQVNHKDSNRANNNVDNLEWCSALENVQHARRKGRYKKLTGDKSGKAKLSEENVKEIRSADKSIRGSLKNLAKKFNVSFPLISRIYNNKARLQG